MARSRCLRYLIRSIVACVACATISTTAAAEMTFPGGLAVDAHYDGFTVPTDQPVRAGGGGTAPAPFDLFLASLGTCAGLYALRFCQQRGIATEGLGVTLTTEREDERGPIAVVRLEVRYGEPQPQEYRDLWVLRFAPDGRVEHFEEWAYWPGKTHSAEGV